MKKLKELNRDILLLHLEELHRKSKLSLEEDNTLISKDTLILTKQCRTLTSTLKDLHTIEQPMVQLELPFLDWKSAFETES
jgi:hypothetical protein